MNGENPQHRVILDGYWIDQTPVTNAMFARFLGERGNQNEENTDWYYPAIWENKSERQALARGKRVLSSTRW